jgi:hypothetical protein
MWAHPDSMQPAMKGWNMVLQWLITNGKNPEH